MLSVFMLNVVAPFVLQNTTLYSLGEVCVTKKSKQILQNNVHLVVGLKNGTLKKYVTKKLKLLNIIKNVYSLNFTHQ
jgi:hypothetical protein